MSHWPHPLRTERRKPRLRGRGNDGRGVGGGARGFAASILLEGNLTSLGLSFPTEKGKKRV